MVTESGIYGGGLYISYAGIEQVVVDGLEGNDRFYIVSTNEKVDVQLVGGLGSDTFNVAGGTNGQPITVVSNSLEGHSALINHILNKFRPQLQRHSSSPEYPPTWLTAMPAEWW